MQLWIDDTQLDSIDNLEAAFELARKHAEEANRLIIDIQADGQPIDDNLLDEPPTDCAGIQELRLTTTDHTSFLCETINSAKEALQLTREDQVCAAELIRSGQLEPAIESLQAVLEGWHAVRDVIGQSATLAEINIDTLTFSNTTGEQCVDHLSKTLADIRTSLEKQDWASLGDAIEYDLEEQIINWGLMLGSLHQAITSKK